MAQKDHRDYCCQKKKRFFWHPHTWDCCRKQWVISEYLLHWRELSTAWESSEASWYQFWYSRCRAIASTQKPKVTLQATGKLVPVRPSMTLGNETLHNPPRALPQPEKQQRTKRGGGLAPTAKANPCPRWPEYKLPQLIHTLHGNICLTVGCPD